MNIIKGALAATIVGAGLLVAAPHAAGTPPLHAGPCLLGHINPNPNSACRGSDSANWPRVPADPNGIPRRYCGPENDGESVETEDVHGGRHGWICEHVTNITGEEFWEWKEVLLGRQR